METGRSLLIDTNIVIQLEDDRPVATEYAELQRRCSTNNVRIFVHEASKLDIDRDRNSNRKAVTRSKLGKFELLANVASSPRSHLELRFGAIKDENDAVDVALLDAVDRGIVDFLVSQDEGLHRRARLAGITDRVFRIREALEWLARTYEPTRIQLPYLREGHCYNIAGTDPILETLRDDYPVFDVWFRRVQQRPCWMLEINNEIAGVVIRKDNEPRNESEATLPGSRILKISTFKVKPEFRGEKLGEHLLKQVLWYAQKNDYDLAYLTAYADKQVVLVTLLEQFGFRRTSIKDNGESVYEKLIGRGPVTEAGAPLDLAVEAYPRFVTDNRVRAFVVPIRPEWHAKLFPENVPQTDLFAPLERTPGNTIRKVYLCRTRVSRVDPGDILLFYVSGDSMASGTVRTVAVAERMLQTSDPVELLRMTGGRSVYTEKDLTAMATEKPSPVKVVDFLLVGHLESPIPLSTFIEMGILTAWPQSFVKVRPDALSVLDLHRRLGY